MALELMHKCMITGTVILIIIIGTFALTSDSQSIQPITWTVLIISIGAGIIIALIVDDKAKESHSQVIASQEQINVLLRRLEETNRLHNNALTALRESRQSSEKLARNSIETTLQYIINILEKLFNIIDPENLKRDDKQLVTKILGHFESPLNLIIQAVPQTDSSFTNYKDELIQSVETLRKLVIASIVISDSETKRTVIALKKSKEKLDDILIKIKSN